MLDEKPPLDEDLLIHFGVKGMHWGVRRNRTSDSATRPIKSTAKKVLIGAGIAGGAAAAAFVLANHGTVRIPSKVPAAVITTRVPSPFELQLQAGMAAHRLAMDRIGAQVLTEKTWRDSARLAQMTKH